MTHISVRSLLTPDDRQCDAHLHERTTAQRQTLQPLAHGGDVARPAPRAPASGNSGAGSKSRASGCCSSMRNTHGWRAWRSLTYVL